MKPPPAVIMRLARWLGRHWLSLNAVAAAVLLVFAFGVAVGTFRIAPYSLLEKAAGEARDWIEYPLHNAGLRPEKFLYPMPPGFAGDGTTRPRAGAYDGLTFVTGFFDDTLGMRLLDMEGRTLHAWHVSFHDIWAEAPHVDPMPDDWDTQIHGALLYPNGDVVFNFQYGGLVKIDACSKPLWKLAAHTHHAVFKAADGHLWVPSRKWRETPTQSLPNADPPFWEDFVLEVSPGGRVLREFSLLDVIGRAAFEGVVFANGAHSPGVEPPLDGDFTHLNDVEILPPGLAAAFPQFNAGDILVSARNLDLLLVLDHDDLTIKWSMVGPFLRQHDPDFTVRGTLSLFDNRRDGARGTRLGGSRILEIDPRTRRIRVRYEGDEAHPLYTETMGEQQYLPNGNVLITESETGRAFEVNEDGTIVWSYVNRWNDEYSALIGRATRYPSSYRASIEEKPCAKPKQPNMPDPD